MERSDNVSLVRVPVVGSPLVPRSGRYLRSVMSDGAVRDV